jgi:hypothetical protein
VTDPALPVHRRRFEALDLGLVVRVPSPHNVIVFDGEMVDEPMARHARAALKGA